MKLTSIKLCVLTVLSILAVSGAYADCGAPAAASLHQNYGATDGSEAWFSFTPDEDGIYAVYTTLASSYLYPECGQEGSFIAYNQVFDLKAADKILFTNAGFADDYDFDIVPVSKLSGSGDITIEQGPRVAYFMYSSPGNELARFKVPSGYYLMFTEVKGQELNYDELSLYYDNKYFLTDAGDYLFIIYPEENGTFDKSISIEFNTGSPEPGEYYTNPISLEANSNNSSIEGYYLTYYSFYAEESGMVAGKSIGYNTGYRGMVLNISDGMSVVNTTGYNLFEYIAEAGNEYLIELRTERKKHDWSLNLSSDKGLYCENQIVLSNTGEISVDEQETEYFFSFAAPSSGEYTFDPGQGTGGEEGYGSSIKIFDSKCDTRYDFHTENITLDLKDGEIIYFSFKAADDTRKFSIYSGAPEGKSCTNPINVSTGADILYPENTSELFYRFVPQENMLAVISNGLTTNRVYAYTGCGQTQVFVAEGFRQELVADMEAGVEYIIKWEGYYGMGFTWSITAGTPCSELNLVAAAGDNDYVKGCPKIQYSYTATRSGIATVSDANTIHNDVKAWKAGDNSLVYEGQLGEMVFDIAEGQEYIIEWVLQKAASSWTLEEGEALPGKSCATAIEITEQIFDDEVFYLAKGEKIFMLYTPAETGRLIAASVERNDYFHAGINSICVQNPEWYKQEHGFIVEKGKTYNLTFASNLSYDHRGIKLSFEDVAIGETEFTPIEITENGEYSVGDKFETVYFIYTAQADELLEIEYNYADMSQIGNFRSQIKAGETTYITMKVTNENTSFRFSARAPQPGETQEKAFDIELGTNTYNGSLTSLYYKYKYSQSKILTLETADGQFTVSPVPSEDYYFSDNGKLSFEAAAGKEYNITFKGFSGPDASWDFSMADPLEGESVSKPIAITGNGEFTATGYSDKHLSWNYFSYTAAGAETIHIKAGCASIRIYKNGQNLSFGEEINFDLEAGSSVIIRTDLDRHSCSDHTFTFEAENKDVPVPVSYTFTVLSGGNPVAGAVVTIGGSSYATDAEGKLTLQLMPGEHAYSIFAEAYAGASGTASVSQASTSTTVAVIKQKNKINVTFLSAGQPLENVNVLINGNIYLTGSNGKLMLLLDNGSYDISAGLDGYLEYSGKITVDNADDELSIILFAENTQLHPISITVKSGNNYMPGTKLTIGGGTYFTDAGGKLDINIPAGEYTLTAERSGYKTESRPMLINTAAVLEIELEQINTADYAAGKPLALYPNPAKDYICLPIATGRASVMIYSASGSLLRQIELSQGNCIQLAGIEPGIYKLKILTGEALYAETIIIE
jgi:hypothetical protein